MLNTTSLWGGPLWAIEPMRFAEVRTRLLSLRIEQALKAQSPDDPPLPLPMAVTNGVARVDVAGPMMKNVGWIGAMLGFADTMAIRRAVETAAADPTVESILLRIDSPGGSVDGMAELGDAVAAASARKPVNAQIDGTGASAAYWTASQARKVYAGRLDIVGSIGVLAVLWDTSKAFADAGVNPIVISTGPFKATGEPGMPVTPEQRDYLQGLVDSAMGEFRKTVMAGRKMTPTQFKSVSDGRVWTGPDAKDLGLVDKIQGMDQTMAEMMASASARRAERNRRARAQMGTILLAQNPGQEAVDKLRASWASLNTGEKIQQLNLTTEKYVVD